MSANHKDARIAEPDCYDCRHAGYACAIHYVAQLRAQGAAGALQRLAALEAENAALREINLEYEQAIVTGVGMQLELRGQVAWCASVIAAGREMYAEAIEALREARIHVAPHVCPSCVTAIDSILAKGSRL